MKFEPGKTYPLRGGGEGEVFVEKDGKLWGRIKEIDGCWYGTDWFPNGRYWGKEDSSRDLIAQPTTVDMYLNVYRGGGAAHSNKEDALIGADSDAIAKAVPVTFIIHSPDKIEVKGGVG